MQRPVRGTRLPPEWDARLTAMAKATERSRSAILRIAVRRFLEDVDRFGLGVLDAPAMLPPGPDRGER